MLLTIPTLLTWTRIVAIPFMVGVFYLSETTASLVQQNAIATLLFIIFALTDWLDGYLARKLNQTSAFGAFLDPVADKILVCASLLVLVHLHRVNVLAALVVVGRELAVSALREWMAQLGASKNVAVHQIGKIKTSVQMLAIPLLLFNGEMTGFGMHINTKIFGDWLMALAVVLTVWSMVYYLKQALPTIRHATSTKKKP